MSKLYDDVNKHTEQIDDLRTTVSEHTTRIETLETAAMTAPPPQTESSRPLEVCVNMPKNIATKENVEQAALVALEKQQEKFKKELGDDYKRLAYDVGEQVRSLRYRVDNIAQGQWWLTTPLWVRWAFVILLVIAAGCGYGFYNRYQACERLQDTEWLYRRQRLYYEKGKGQQDLINLEREYITGTPHERDSIRNWIRKVEHNLEVEKTFTYFAPTEP